MDSGLPVCLQRPLPSDSCWASQPASVAQVFPLALSEYDAHKQHREVVRKAAGGEPRSGPYWVGLPADRFVAKKRSVCKFIVPFVGKLNTFKSKLN